VLRQLRSRCVVGCCTKDLLHVVNLAPLLTLSRSLPQHFPPIPSSIKNSQEQLLTGNTIGTPPLTALLPSVFAFSLTHSFSLPAASFQLIIVAPKSSTSMLSPVGSTADTRSLECEIVTCACGAKPGVAESAEGFFGRSTMVAGVEQGGTSELWCEGSVGLRVLGQEVCWK